MAPLLTALDELRRRDRRAAVRTSFITLLAVGGESIGVDEIFDTVHRLGTSQPSRVVVLRVVGGEGHRLDARVGVHLLSRGTQCLAVDDIALDVAGQVRRHLDSVVEPLTLPDLPIVLWCWERLPPAWSPLIDLADHLVVDSARAGGRDRLPALAELQEQVPVTDFSWLRLLPLRRRLAAALRRPENLRALDQVSAVTVAGPEPERALLAGWLRRSLNLSGAALTEVEGGQEMRVVLETAQLEVRVEAGDGMVTETVERPGCEPWSSCASSSPASTESLLAATLVGLRPDPVFARALDAAASG